MYSIEFDRDNFTITWRGQSIVLLPKEYALLEFMNQNSGQTLSRDHLLDAVWKLESPIDRTVDDHVYRLRKKLMVWDPMVKIETVRGAGYRFIVKLPEQKENPLQHVPSFSIEMREIVNTYLRYGRGDALLTLSRHKDVFGFEIDPAFRLFFRFMEGDARFLVEEGTIPFTERAFLLLYLYQILNPQENREYVETVLRCKTLPSRWQNELETQNLITMYMDWGEYDKAKEKLDSLSAEVERHKWEGLVPYVANLKLEYDLRIQDWEALNAGLQLAEDQLERYPYQREEGQFYILKGIALCRLSLQEGLPWIERGVNILKQSKFLPHLIKGIRTAIHFSEFHGWKEIHDKYVNEWNRLSRRIGLEQIKDQIKQQLQTHLGTL